MHLNKNGKIFFSHNYEKNIIIFLLHNYFHYFYRARYHKLKYGTDLVIPGDVKPPIYEEGSSTCANSEVGGGGDGEAPFTSVSNISWRQGRKILRQ